ncbi:MAG: hypothetical protein WA940_00270 [Sphingopyxis sp.]
MEQQDKQGAGHGEHAHEPRRCVITDIATVNGDTDEAQAFIVKANEYLAAFAAPLKIDGYTTCFHCGTRMDGMMHALGVGAAYVWGMAHGEAACSKCGWPARGMHYPKDEKGEMFTLRNFFLAYMPDQVSVRSAAA